MFTNDFYNKKYLFFIFVLGLIFLGCVSHVEPPEKWASFQKEDANNCPDISGVYQNFAQFDRAPLSFGGVDNLWYRLSGSYSPLKIESLLMGDFEFMKEEKKIGSAYKVKITSKNDRLLLIEPIEGEKVLSSITLSEKTGDFECSEGRLWMKPKIDTSTCCGIGKTKIKIGFVKAADDSLIGEDRLSSVGAYLWVIPMIGKSNDWYRWMPE